MIAANADVADYVLNLQCLPLTVVRDKNYHPLSSILVPPSFILIPLSSVLRPASCVLRPPYTVLHPPSSVNRPPSTVERPPSSLLVRLLLLVFLSNENRFDTTYVLIAINLLKYMTCIMKVNIQTLLLSHNTHS